MSSSSENQAIIDAVKEIAHVPQVLHVGDRRLICRPVSGGFQFETEKAVFGDVDPKPEWRQGFAQLSTLDSMIDYINLYKDEDSVAFIDRDNGRIRAVLDYHKQGPDMVQTARHGGFGAVYEPSKSPQWQTWTGIANHRISNGQAMVNWMSQEAFCDLIHVNILDLDPVIALDPESPGDQALERLLGLHAGRVAMPEQMMAMARGLRFTQTFEATEVYDRNTGTRRVTFVENEEDTPEEVALTNFFLLAIPVFEGGELFRLGGHLTYKLSSKKVLWRIELLRKRAVLEAAIDGLETKLRSETGIPVFSEG